jgi:ABC-type phosphate/phosphonate transport system substrate-binding protein
MSTPASPWVAAFPMYMRAELAPAFHALWALARDRLRAQGIDVPDALTPVETDLLGFWQRPDLLLSQTCGYPFRHFLKDRVTLVGTPDFALPDCPPGFYRSAIVVQADDPRESLADHGQSLFACNDIHSQSGYAAPLVEASRHGVRFGQMVLTGSHLASARMVAERKADLAGIDAVSWRNMVRFDPWTSRLRVLCWTTPTPGLPLVTAAPQLAPALAAAVTDAIRALQPDHRDLLGLQGLVAIPAERYAEVEDPPA